MIELVVVATALLLSAPIMLVIAAIIFFKDGRPIFFSQVRIGRQGYHFRIYKFRKFHASEGAGAPLTLAKDSRLTRFGRFLARTKLDELPQLWNIVCGDMAIVGPRPESLDFVACFSGRYRCVLGHRPGVFGPNQVVFRDEGALFEGRADPEQFYRTVLFPIKADIDAAYFAQRTVYRDFGWCVRGLQAILGWGAVLSNRKMIVKTMEDGIGRSGSAGQVGLADIGLAVRFPRWGAVEISIEGESTAAAGIESSIHCRREHRNVVTRRQRRARAGVDEGGWSAPPLSALWSFAGRIRRRREH
ncbi:MAG: sugar transferase [Stellaceae bacterium]